MDKILYFVKTPIAKTVAGGVACYLAGTLTVPFFRRIKAGYRGFVGSKKQDINYEVVIHETKPETESVNTEK